MLILLALIVSSASAFDNWYCKTVSSERRENVIAACGVATAPDEGGARASAFVRAQQEFNRVCDASFSCKNHKINADPQRTECNKVATSSGIEFYKCIRLVNFYIGPFSEEQNSGKVSNALRKFPPLEKMSGTY